MKKIDRQAVINTLIRKLEPLNYVHAFWEAGSISFNRTDTWSDIDLYVVSDDDKIEDVFRMMEDALSKISEFDLKYRLPEPNWHGHSQVFWRLKWTSPFLFLDIVVMKKSSPDKFLQYKIHGAPVIHFDKTGLVRDDPVDQESLLNKILGRLETLKITFPLFQVLVLKGLNRGQDMDALGYYLGMTFRPLVEVLNIKYRPLHYNFHTTYVYHELPGRVVKKLRELYFVKNAEHLKKCRDEAEEWFWKVLAGIDRDEIKAGLKQNGITH
jgi:predicted nucleotidyltransferase